MSKNYIPEIAKMLGVGIGEEFKLKGTSFGLFTFTSDNLLCSGGNKEWKVVQNSLFIGILTGEYTVQNVPFKPKDNETYYYILPNGVIYAGYWKPTAINIALYLMGNFFRSKAQAEANKDEIMKKYQNTIEEIENN